MIKSLNPAALIRPRSEPLLLKLIFFLPLAIFLFVTDYGSMIYMYSSDSLPFLRDGQLIGGDYYVFWTSSKALIDGYSLSNLYNPEFFSNYIDIVWNSGDGSTSPVPSGTYWQYPPIYGLAVIPLAYLPYTLSYAVWSLFGVTLFITVLWRSLKPSGTELLIVLCCPLIFYAVITGQNGLFTGTLLFAAAYYAGPKPVLAGVCAGLLMIKPHFGLLLPFVYASGGHWKSFKVATITSLVLFAFSIVVFGVDSWIEFPKILMETGDRISTRDFAIHLMRTPYIMFLYFGFSESVAMSLQLICTFILITANFWLWKKSKNRELNTAFLLCSAILAVPYACHYEFIFLIPAGLLMIRQIKASARWILGFEITCLFAWLFIDFYPIFDPTLRITISVALITVMLVTIWRLSDFDSSPICPTGTQNNHSNRIVT